MFGYVIVTDGRYARGLKVIHRVLKILEKYDVVRSNEDLNKAIAELERLKKTVPRECFVDVYLRGLTYCDEFIDLVIENFLEDIAEQASVLERLRIYDRLLDAIGRTLVQQVTEVNMM